MVSFPVSLLFTSLFIYFIMIMQPNDELDIAILDFSPVLFRYLGGKKAIKLTLLS